MKLPSEGIGELLAEEGRRRALIAETEARMAAREAARQEALEAVVTTADEVSARKRPDPGLPPPPREAGALVDEIFARLTWRERRAGWEELAAAASALGLGRLARALDRLAMAAGTERESYARIEVASAAASARQDPPTVGRIRLSDLPAMLVRHVGFIATVEVARIRTKKYGFFAVDESGEEVRIESDGNAAGAGLAAILSDLEPPVNVEFVFDISANSGVYATPVAIEIPEQAGQRRGGPRIRLARSNPE